MLEIDEVVFDIVRSRARWNKQLHLRVTEIQRLASARFPGCGATGERIVRAIDRLHRRGQLRWARVRDDDVYVLP